MPGTVKLDVVSGPMQGQSFRFDEHDTFLFGRQPDCHAQLPHDPKVSRHHFLLEANPPDVRLRDLGSLNGTHINGTRHGGRSPDETPEQGRGKQHPEVELSEGDCIRVGATELHVAVDCPVNCQQCGVEIDDGQKEQCKFVGGTFICPACRAKLEAEQAKAGQANKTPPPPPVHCQQCGKDVRAEAKGRHPYVCKACRDRKADEDDPVELLKEILRRKGLMKDTPSDAPNVAGYRVGNKLGVGGFGAVYLAVKDGTEEPFALKVMLSRVAVDEKARDKFAHEIEVMKGMDHPNIVRLHDHGSADGAFYFIMDFCEGGSLDDVFKQRGQPMPLSEVGPLMVQALDGLAYAHKNGLVHRDLKPANIMLGGTPDQRLAKIADLGLAKNFQQAGFSGMTMTGHCAGTPAFMPREQVTNFKYVKPASDVWSAAATLYFLLTGAFPRDFERGDDPMEVILRGSIVPIDRRCSCPSRVAKVINKALSNDVADRYEDAGEFHKALRRAM
jgi:hypothetical protein